jgi:CDP-paratose 2-epimerase
MKACVLSRHWSLIAVAFVRLLFVITFSANVGGDSFINVLMMLRGESNLVMPPGYAFLMGVPFRALFGAAALEANQGPFLFAVMVLQHVVAFIAIVLLHKMVGELVGRGTAHAVTLIVGLHWGFIAGTSQIGPEWLQATLLIAVAFSIFRATRATAHRRKLLFYGAAAVLFAVAYLVKFNALYFAVLFAAALVFAERVAFRHRLVYAGTVAAVFLSAVGAFKVFYQKPKTGTYALTHDRAWVLLAKSGYFCPLAPENGPNTKRLLLLNTLLPWDNKNVGSIPRIDFVAPDIEDYRRKYLWILTASNHQLDALLARTELRKDFNFFTAFSPTTYYLGLAEGDQLGVEVFKECVAAHPGSYTAHVLDWTFARLFELVTINPYPLNVDTGFKGIRSGSWHWFDGTGLKRNGTDPFDNRAGYYVWAPALPLFSTLRAAYLAVPNWLISGICFVGFVHALARRRSSKNWLLVFCGTLTFGFILASNMVFDFRWYEELFAVLPYIAVLFSVSTGTAAAAAVEAITRHVANVARSHSGGPEPPSGRSQELISVPSPAAARPVPVVGRDRRALVTGSAGLIGSACTRLLCEQGWQVIGLDNNMRQEFFGPAGSTRGVVTDLRQTFSMYEHHDIDIRDRAKIRDLFEAERPDLIIHTAAQPSHDKAALIPYEDFDVNASGTVNLLVAARDFVRDSPLCFTSTNKVYGDRPNFLPLVEKEKRFDYADGRDGIDETLSIDTCLHSLFGASKVAADVMCQEFGRYFQMPVGIFRAGCLTGPQHAAVELHGYLAYIVACAVEGRPYTIFGYKGKQVRDQIHCRDVARLFLEFYESPRCGEIYNLGGGRANSLSILETIDLLADLGCTLQHTYSDINRVGDHICYISDLAKLHAHFPDWKLEYDLASIVYELVARYRGTPRP